VPTAPTSVDTTAAGEISRTAQLPNSATKRKPKRGDRGFLSTARPLGLLNRAAVPTLLRVPAAPVGGAEPANVVTLPLLALHASVTTMRRIAWLNVPSAKKRTLAFSGLITR
jgi:hypothetical protein